MKSEFNFSLIRANGQVIDMHSKNWWVSYFRVQPPSFSRTTEKLEGAHGLIEKSVTINSRAIQVMIQIEGYDAVDFDYLRDEIYRTFNPLEDFTIVRDLQPGKCYSVKVENLSGIQFEEGSLEDGYFEVEFVMLQPFVQSINTTLQLQNKKAWDANLWQWAQGIDGDTAYQYEFTTSSFVVKNIGDVPIDPCQHELTITIVATASNLRITNETTGEHVQYNGVLTNSDQFVLQGIQYLKNGVSVLRNTNKRLLTLQPGDNKIKIEGGTVIRASFDFRPLYY